LRQLKDATPLAAGAVATRRERALERDLLGTNMAAASAAEATPAGEVPDATKTYAAAQKLSTLLISRTAVVPVAAAAVLPLVAAGATQLPVRELLRLARGPGAAMSQHERSRARPKAAAQIVSAIAALAVAMPAAATVAEDPCQGLLGFRTVLDAPAHGPAGHTAGASRTTTNWWTACRGARSALRARPGPAMGGLVWAVELSGPHGRRKFSALS
jgi:hypothetical protein